MTYHTGIYDEDDVPADVISKMKELCKFNHIDLRKFDFCQLVNEVGIEYTLSYEHPESDVSIHLIFKRNESDQIIEERFELTQD